MQLFTVLGLLKFTNTENSLFLLDEPDTHLNPNWSRDYVNKYIKNLIISENIKTHVLLTTHDPVLIGGMKKEDVIIMKYANNTVIAEHPHRDPMGSSYDGILTGDAFELSSAISPELENEIERKTILLFKEDKTPQENQELKELKERLGNYDYNIMHDDPLYENYLKARTEVFDTINNKLPKEKYEQSVKILKDILKVEE